MQVSTRIFAVTALAAFAGLGSAAASAQTWNGGGSEAIGQSTSMSATTSTEASREVDAGAVAAAHPTGTEATGQSTSMPMPTSTLSAEEAYKNAVAAAHPAGTEATGQSTAMPMPRGSGS